MRFEIGAMYYNLMEPDLKGLKFIYCGVDKNGEHQFHRVNDWRVREQAHTELSNWRKLNLEN